MCGKVKVSIQWTCKIYKKTYPNVVLFNHRPLRSELISTFLVESFFNTNAYKINEFLFISSRINLKLKERMTTFKVWKLCCRIKYDSNFSGFFDEILSDWFTISFLVPSPCLWFRWDVTLSSISPILLLRFSIVVLRLSLWLV